MLSTSEINILRQQLPTAPNVQDGSNAEWRYPAWEVKLWTVSTSYLIIKLRHAFDFIGELFNNSDPFNFPTDIQHLTLRLQKLQPITRWHYNNNRLIIR